MRKKLEIVALAALLAGLVAGLYGRLDGFGLRPLAVDEYYFGQSVRFILDQGLPLFPSGGYYVRGPILQYLTAASSLVLGENEFAFRFPSLLFNLGSVLLAYAYGRRIAGRPAAVALALMLLLSSWQIEFARFARMYSAFQFCTLLFLIAVDDAFVRGHRRRRYLPHLLVLVAVLTHELGILLSPLLFLPLLTAQGRSRFPSLASMARFAFAGVVTLLACTRFYWARLRNRGVLDRFPEGYSPSESGGPFRLPEFSFWSVSESGIVNLALLCGLLLLAAVAVGAWRLRRPNVTSTDLFAALLLVSAATHSLVLFAAFSTILLFRERILEPGRHPGRVYLFTGLSILLALGWVAWGLTHLQALGQVPGGPGVPDLLRRAFFGWPDFYIPLWMPLWRSFPLLSLMLVAALAYHVLTKIGKPPADWIGHPVFFVGYIAICFGVLRSQYTETRYVFFLYPAMLCVIVSAAVELARRLSAAGRVTPRPAAASIGAALCVFLYLLSHDFNPRQIRLVASDEVTYRTGEFARYKSAWYPRLDYRSAAEYVNLQATDDGRSRIVVAGQPPVSFYLRQDHAVYYDRDDPRFRNVCRERGTRELWSDQRLLSTSAELRRYAAGADVVWIVEDPGDLRGPFAAGPVWGAETGTRTTALRTVDGRLQVTRVVLE